MNTTTKNKGSDNKQQTNTESIVKVIVPNKQVCLGCQHNSFPGRHVTALREDKMNTKMTIIEANNSKNHSNYCTVSNK